MYASEKLLHCTGYGNSNPEPLAICSGVLSAITTEKYSGTRTVREHDQHQGGEPPVDLEALAVWRRRRRGLGDCGAATARRC